MHVERTAACKPNGRRIEKIYSFIDAALRQRWSVSVIPVVLLATGAFWNSLSGGFHFDDDAIFLTPAVVSDGFGLGLLHWMQTRPLTFLTFHWNYLVSGADPVSWHAVNVALHVLNAALVFALARRFVPAYAWVAAALFAVHPLQTQAVNYVFERATLLAAAFALVSAILYFRRSFVAAVGLFALSLLAKEETVALPALLLLIEVARGTRPAWGALCGMASVALAAAVRLFLVLQATPEPGLGFSIAGLSVPTYALTQCRVIWHYARLLVWPAGLNLDHDVGLSRGLLDPPTTAAGLVALTGSVALLAYLAWHRRSLAAGWGLGSLLLLAPSSSFVPVQDVMFEHRVYFPMAALTVAAAMLAARVGGRWRMPVTLGVLAALFVVTVLRNPVWRTEESLWTDVTEKSPGKARGWLQLARATSDPVRRREIYTKALQLDPDNSAGWMNFGLSLAESGDTNSALECLQKALGLHGDRGMILNNIGSVRLRRGELAVALGAFREALTADRCRFDARYNLARTLAYTGDKAGARDAAALPASCTLLPPQEEQLNAFRRELR